MSDFGERIMPDTVVLWFDYRNVKNKRYADTVLIDTDTGNTVPSELELLTERYGKRIYKVEDGKMYLKYDVDYSSLGNVYILIQLIEVNKSLEERRGEPYDILEHFLIVYPRDVEDKKIEEVVKHIPNGMKDLLLKNADRLPFFKTIKEFFEKS